jgi:hypothetical protein
LGADGNNNNNSVAAAAGQVDFSPAFIWLLRDFQLRLEANNKPITPAEYLEEALLPIKGGAADIANKNQVRSDLRLSTNAWQLLGAPSSTGSTCAHAHPFLVHCMWTQGASRWLQ